MSGPDPLPPIPDATGVLRARSEDAGFEADFADLAARFAAQSGGGLSPELSADLALEIVLNEVVEQACLATGATGAAVVLQRGGEMVCRATSGPTAPDLGARLDTASGLSGECIKTQRTQRCDDILVDARVDVGSSQRLGVRSVMVMPLLRGAELAGVFEVFSSLPNAFGERDERTLEVLAGRILTNLERAAQPLPARNEPQRVSEAVQEMIPEMPESFPRRRFDIVTAVLGVSVLFCAVLLGVLLDRHLGLQKPVARARPAAATSSVNPVSPAPATNAPLQAKKETLSAPSLSAPSMSDATVSSRKGGDSVPAGDLLVYENGKEVFRMSPAKNKAEVARQGNGMERASAVDRERRVELSPTAAEGSLLHRVEPEYPEEARQQNIQGAVVLEVQIGGDGAVQDVQVVSGPQQLAQVSSDAVKQWRFKPRTAGGRSVEMQTRVTLNFRLPQ